MTARMLLAAAAASALGSTALAAGPEVIFSEITTHPSSTVPGALDAGGAPAVTQFRAIEEFWVSPNGQHWIVKARTQQGSDLETILLAGSGSSGTALAQEGQPVQGASPGIVYDFFQGDNGVSNNGNMAIDVRPRPGSGDMIIKVTGGVHTVHVQPGDALFGLLDTGASGFPTGDETPGNSIGSVHLLDDGRVGWGNTPITNLHSSRYPAAFYDHDAFVQSDITTFTGAPPNLLDGVSYDSFRSTPDGAHWAILGDDDPSVSSNDVAIYDGALVLRQGDFIPGTFNQIVNIISMELAPNGDWYARVDGPSNGDWAIRNGEVVAAIGDPIVPGSLEHWSTITRFVGNSNGDFIIAGTTDSPNAAANEVVVLNGLVVVMRENDPVDVDGNGMFDDDAFIGQAPNTGAAFRSGLITLTDDLQLFAIGSLRNAAGVEYIDAAAFGTPDVFLRQDLFEPVAGDLSVTILDTPDPVPALSDEVTYTVMVVNASPAPATNVNVVTQLDDNTTFVSATAGSHAGGVHTVNFASIPARSAEVFEIVVTADQFDTLFATTTVGGAETDPNLANNTATAETLLSPLADLIVTVNDSPDPMHIRNGAITYEVTITNNGPEDAPNVVATFDLPSQSTFSSTTHGTHDGSPTGGTVTANLGTLPLLSSVNVTVVADIGGNGAYAFNATAVSDLSDLTPGDATAFAGTTVLVESDVVVTLTESSDPVVGLGTYTYTLELANDGPTDAENVTWSVTLPSQAAFVSSTAGSHAAGVVSGAAALITAGSSEFITIEVNAQSPTPAAFASAAANVGAPADPDTSNNSVSIATRIVSSIDDLATVIFSDDALNTHAAATLSTSQVPGIAGRFVANFDRPFVSPDGAKWVLNIDLTGDTTTSEILVVDDGVDRAVVLQERVSSLPNPFMVVETPETIDTRLSINDAAEVAAAVNTIGGPTGADEIILKISGPLNAPVYTVMAREADQVPGGMHEFYSAALTDPNITNDGTVWFAADTTISSTTLDEILVSTADGVNIVVQQQEGVSAVAGVQLGNAPEWDEWDADLLFVSGDGMHTLIAGDVGGSALSDDVLVFDGQVVVQEETQVHPMFGEELASVSPVDGAYLAGNNDWYMRGDVDDGTDYVLRNGTLIAWTGQEIFPGSGEHWDDAAITGTWRYVVGDHLGNYVLVGETDATPSSTDEVAILNGTTLIAREGDPIDLNGDGVLNDDAYINSFGEDDGIISNGRLLTVIMVKNGAGSNIGDAFVAFDLGLAPACVCETDGDANQVNVFDLLAYLDDWFAQTPAADIDGTAGVNVFDLLFFLDCWFPASAGTPCA